jgi:hypothetical protein
VASIAEIAAHTEGKTHVSIVRIHHDKETYSEADLTRIGAHKYARDPSTDCLLTSGLVEGEKHTRRWRPGDRYPYADIHPDDIEIHAWNSQFERLIWEHVMVPVYGWPKLALEQFVCVSAQARSLASGPAKLDVAGQFFQQRHKKDNKGHLHMLKMCRPATEKQQLDWLRGAVDRMGRTVDHDEAKRCHHTAKDLDRLHDYCDQDVFTEYQVAGILPEWGQEELDAFHESERINDHGLVVDRDFALAAADYAEDEKAYFARRIVEITNGEVQTPRQFQRIAKWVLPLMSDDAVEMTVWHDDGVKKNSFDADTRANLLAECSRDSEFIGRARKLRVPKRLAAEFDDEDADDLDAIEDPDKRESAGDVMVLRDCPRWAVCRVLEEFIEVLDMAGNSTVSKYQVIADRAMLDKDGNWRVRGLYMFAGAAQSGRYSSTGIQMHNLKRDVPKNASELIRAFKREDREAVQKQVDAWCAAHNAKLGNAKKNGIGATTGKENARAEIGTPDKWKKNPNKGDTGASSGQRKLEPEPVHALGRLVRPTITGCPEDRFDLAWCDWSSIEACVLPWLSMHPGADDRLALLRRGEDLYCKTASGICGRKVTKEDEFERQAFGKVPELSLGYGGGIGAFLAMGKNYGVHLREKEVDGIVKAWREENQWAVDFWNDLEHAAQNAILYPGRSYSAGRVSYRYDPDALDGIGSLYAMLPSGRELSYPGARLDVSRKFGREVLTISAMKAAWRPKKGEKTWPRVALWRGLLAENATQAVATGDLLNIALLRCRRAGLVVCSHTHDEIMIETPDPERDGERLKSIMLKKPNWPGVDALPLKAEVGMGFRYKVKFPEAEGAKKAA